MEGLTKRQREILQFITQFIAQRQYAPSYREIMRHFGLSSVSSVAKHIAVLRRKGAIDQQASGRRSLALIPDPNVRDSTSDLEVPFIGQVTLGGPIELFPKIRTLPVPRFLVPNPDTSYILRARIQTVSQEQISDGDLLIVETRNHASHGELTLRIRNGKTTALRYFGETESDEKPGVLQGIIIGLIRMYS